MFQNLSERLGQLSQQLSGRGRITEDNVRDAMREVRMALLEADVALPVVKQFIEQVRERALGQEVLQSLTPGQALVAVVRDELVHVLGEPNPGFQIKAQAPAVILMAGLQGSGKTTTTAKLARLLREQQHKKVLLVSADVYRPAAIEQLATVGQQVQVDVHPSSVNESPAAIAASALEAAKKGFYDILIVDTAGRLAIDAQMMEEIGQLHSQLNPAETLFVVDAMTGQDAANTAAAFAAKLPLTGVVLTKVDGDARGGAALSVRQVAGAPIKFMGVGEKLDALELFHPDRLASRILGMGDVLSLVEQAEQKIDRKKAEKLAGKVMRGRGFDLADFRDQLQQMGNMGGLAGLLDKIPGAGRMPQGVDIAAQEKQMQRMVAIINSMTPKERRFPDLMKASRKRRVAVGSGTQVQDVNRLLKQFQQSQKMMKQMSRKGGRTRMARMLGGGGGMPPGFPGLR